IKLLLWATYQVFLHPLSKFPGPVVAKLSDIYSGFYTYKKCLHLTTWKNHHRYGSVVRQGPNKLVFSSVTALRGKGKDIYKNYRTTKPEAYMALGPGLTAYNVFTAVDRDLHRARRQLIGQVITDRSMRVFEPTMIKHVDIFERNLLRASQSSNPVNITKQTRKLGLDLAALLGFGYELNLQTNNENQFIEAVLDTGTWTSNIFLHFPLARRLRLGPVFMFSLLGIRPKYLALMDTMITSRMAEPKDAKHDLYSFVADALATESKRSLGGGESISVSRLVLHYLSPGDTVKTALSSTFFYLSRNPKVYQRLAAEIRSTFTSGNEITGTGVSSCSYLRACIDEAIRISPPAAGILWRDLAPNEDKDQQFIVDGYVIPRGTTVGLNTYSLHHNEDYFPDSFSYNPERWLDSSDYLPETKRIMRDAFAPFSIGPRGCAGKAMAYLETSLVLAKTMWYFDFEASLGELGEVGAGNMGSEEGRERRGEFQLYDIFNMAHDGPYLNFRVRGDFWKGL
ncbi:cytochrome P450 monooxygenase-like protein, partial [Tricladium varicosporioides]